MLVIQERQTKAELYTGELEQLRPERAGEDQIAIADYGSRYAMEPQDLFEEDVQHRCRQVWVPERDEVHALGEAIDHSEDN